MYYEVIYFILAAAAGGARAPERPGRDLQDPRCFRRKRAIRVGASFEAAQGGIGHPNL